MRLLLTGEAGPLLPLLRERLRGAAELVQLGGEWMPGLAIASGDLRSQADLRAAADGADALVLDLQGALVTLSGAGLHEADLGEALVSVTEAAAGAARAVGARRLLVLGSARALVARAGANEPVLDADDLRHWPGMAALRLAMDHASLHAADLAVILAPAALLGPSLPASALTRRLHLSRACVAPPSAVVRLSLADARDASAAAEAALTRGNTGVTYVIGSTPFWLLTLDQRVKRSEGPHSPAPPSPDDLPIGVAWERVRCRAAIRDLGWWTRRPGATLADTLAAMDSRDARTGLS